MTLLGLENIIESLLTTPHVFIKSIFDMQFYENFKFCNSIGVKMLKNVRTRRLMLSRGSTISWERGLEGRNNAIEILASDGNYYNRAHWIIRHYGKGEYIFENGETKRYLFSEGDEIPGDRGCEGGLEEAPVCRGADDDYDNRALWNIVQQENGKYLIASVVNFRYVSSLGEPPTSSEGGWERAPKCVMADANYDDRALWEIIE